MAPEEPTAPCQVSAHMLRGEPPRIDGRLDEPAWGPAEVATGFRQREPGDGDPASQPTEARFLYDAEALYVGIHALDSEPGRITAPVGGKDGTSDTDWVAVDLDTFLDGRTGYRFGLTAAGARLDGALAGDTAVDWDWDGTWEGATARFEGGWSAELRIPFRSLRFGSRSDWGLNVTRHVARRGETSTWCPAPRLEPGWVSRFGRLRGLKAVPLLHRPTLEPWLTLRGEKDPGAGSLGLGLGLDFRSALGAGTSLVGTLHPDFGQVEADAAVLNLTRFETYYPEKRPFFLEGAELFRTPWSLFFSRRIGGRPAPPFLEPGERLLEAPQAVRILEALKLAGVTASGLRFGALQALTAREAATVELAGGGGTASRRAAPLGHYLVVRAERPLPGSSAVGVLATALHREGKRPVWSSGLDWDLRWSEGRLVLDGQLAASRADSRGAREAGLALEAGLRRLGGKRLAGGIGLSALSPNFEINDVGYLKRNELLTASLWLEARWTRPVGPFREAWLNASLDRSWTWSRLGLGRGAAVSLDAMLPSLAWVGGGLRLDLAGLDDLDTRGGPPIATPRSWSSWAYYHTDSVRPLWLEVDLSLGRDAARGSSRSTGLGIGIRPGEHVELRLGGSYSLTRDPAQWIENRDLDGDGRVDRHVYGTLRSQVLDLYLRARVAPSPRLVLELYTQPFLAAGSYSRIGTLAAPRSLEFLPFALDHDPDFATASHYANLVLRWEYRPRSFLVMAWSQDRWAANEPGELVPGRDLAHLLAAPASHRVVVKVTYPLEP